MRRRCQARDETTSAGMITCAFIAGVNMTPDNRNTIPSAFINTADERSDSADGGSRFRYISGPRENSGVNITVTCPMHTTELVSL